MRQCTFKTKPPSYKRNSQFHKFYTFLLTIMQIFCSTVLYSTAIMYVSQTIQTWPPLAVETKILAGNRTWTRCHSQFSWYEFTMCGMNSSSMRQLQQQNRLIATFRRENPTSKDSSDFKIWILKNCQHSWLSKRQKFAEYAQRATKSMRALFGNTGWVQSGLIDDKRGPT